MAEAARPEPVNQDALPIAFRQRRVAQALPSLVRDVVKDAEGDDCFTRCGPEHSGYAPLVLRPTRLPSLASKGTVEVDEKKPGNLRFPEPEPFATRFG